jgi:transcriptional regulator with XRE-family HTH domain
MANVWTVNLARLRKRGKISQKEAAAALGVSQAMLSQYEHGHRECSVDFLVRAATYYAVSCDVLLGLVNQEEQTAARLADKHPLETDVQPSLLTIGRAVATLSPADDDRLTRALTVTLLRAAGADMPVHRQLAVLAELLADVPTQKSNALAVKTVRSFAESVAKECFQAFR